MATQANVDQIRADLGVLSERIKLCPSGYFSTADDIGYRAVRRLTEVGLLGDSASDVVQRMVGDAARAETLSIRIRFEKVYGKLTCYPIDTPAKLFAELAGTKTLTPHACVLAQRLGFSLQVDNLSGELLCQFLKEAQS